MDILGFLNWAAVTHVNAVRTTMGNAAVDAIDAGTTDTTGDLIIMDSADSAIARLSWTATPAFGNTTSGVATMNAINDEASALGGTAALFKFQDRDNGEVMRGTVTGSGGGGDIELSSVNISPGDTVSISSLTYTATP